MKPTKPTILLSGGSESRGAYEEAVTGAGGAPVSCYCPALSTDCDGLLLCGGDDLAPARYGEENYGSEGIDLARDEAEFALARAYLKAGKPILGICRGFQLMNVVLGGTLRQEIGPALRLFHTHDPGLSVDKLHPVRAAEHSFFSSVYGSAFTVNSSHHQAVERLGEGLRPILWSESGIVEAAIHESRSVLCVQFHPERMSFGYARPDVVNGAAVFTWFLNCCKEGKHDS